eukprot:GSMAST32.ASY1.ANO1.1964.1 assembled CDS
MTMDKDEATVVSQMSNMTVDHDVNPPAVPEVATQNEGGVKKKKKRKRKKKKKTQTIVDEQTLADSATSNSTSSTTSTVPKGSLLDSTAASTNSPKGDNKPHKFWDTQPVPKHSAIIESDGAIDPEKKPEDVRADPYPLPKGFEWSVIDPTSDAEIKEIWALQPPGYEKNWHIAVRQTNNRKLRGVITGVPVSIRVRDKNLREVTRRINRKNIWQAKLIDVGFSRLAPRMNMARTIRLYRLPSAPKYVPSACALLNNYLNKFDLAIDFDEADFSHWLLPREVTDMCSFYHLPSSIIGHPAYKTLYACYSYYNVATTMDLRALMEDCLILAKQKKCDVFNALDVMENSTIFEQLKFGPGDGNLQYYLYNWRCQNISHEKVGIVLL